MSTLEDSEKLLNYDQKKAIIDSKVVQAFLKDLDALMARHNVKIDKSRVALGGSSLGGDLSWALSLRNPNLFQGAVTINSRNTYRLNSCGDESSNLESSMSQLAQNNARFAMFIFIP